MSMKIQTKVMGIAPNGVGLIADYPMDTQEEVQKASEKIAQALVVLVLLSQGSLDCELKARIIKESARDAFAPCIPSARRHSERAAEHPEGGWLHAVTPFSERSALRIFEAQRVERRRLRLTSSSSSVWLWPLRHMPLATSSKPRLGDLVNDARRLRNGTL
jgi:hypothetical protein